MVIILDKVWSRFTTDWDSWWGY